MKKLYEKNELWFSLVWIIAYVMVMGNLRGDFGDASPWTMLGVLAFAGGLTWFMGSNHLWAQYGFVRVQKIGKYLYFIPLVLLCTVNLWFGVSVRYAPMGQVFAVVMMATVGFVEEVLFRGLLFRAIEKENTTRAIVISAVTFGAGHIINLLTGHGSAETFMQMAYAIAIGFAFVMVFHRSGSLLPCIIAHSVIDVTSLFARDGLTEQMEQIGNAASAAFLIVVAGGYAWYLWRRTE